MKNKKRCKLKAVPVARESIVSHIAHLGEIQKLVVHGNVACIAIAVTTMDGRVFNSVSTRNNGNRFLLQGAIVELMDHVKELKGICSA